MTTTARSTERSTERTPEGVVIPSRLGVSTRRILKQAIVYACVLVLAITFALPLFWTVSTSLKARPQIYVIPPVWIPNPIVWSNYPEALTTVPFFSFIGNTLQIAIPSAIGAVVSNVIVAYGFSRVRWPLRDTFFYICLSTMMIPGTVTLIPVFLIFRDLNWIDTYLPLIVPAFLGSPFYIFLLRQFFMTIPQELIDAARVDGATDASILLRIIAPLSIPALAVVGLFQFMGSWNDYMGPLIYLRTEAKFTVSLGLSRYSGYGYVDPNWPYLMAASVTMLTPILALFFFTQRTFIEGITLTGIKA